MWVAFAVQKLLTFSQQKISEYCVLNPLKQLTKWPLTSSLSYNALNNWALVFASNIKATTSWVWHQLGSEIFFTQSMLIIMKTLLFKDIENFTTKKGKFSDKKKYDIFHIPAQNIDCGYSLEPPQWGSSNKYPQSMFFSKMRNIMSTSVNSSFTI